MNLPEFKEQVIERIKIDASMEMTSDKEEFLNYISEILIDADEIDDFIFLPFEGVGKRNKKIQIDGYSYNELDEILTLFITPQLTYSIDETLTNSEATKIFSRAEAFIENAQYITENAEESSPGYGLAFDLQNRYKHIRKYCIYILTDMVMSDKIKTFKENEVSKIPVEYHIWDIGRLFQISQSESGKEDIIIKLGDYIKHGIPCLPASITNEYTAYLCNIPGFTLATLYNNYGRRLLEGNVRSFLQTRGKVNKGIRNTILNNPDMFFAYNNGIATTASSMKTIDVDGVKYISEITDLQIVNGGQTTASLAMALLNDKKDGSEEKLKKIYVPMKLSIVTEEKAQELIPNISRYANSQNKVSEADLWSNHPFHIRMEDFSRRILAPTKDGNQYGTHWYYERANGQYKQETYKSTASEKNRFKLQNPTQQMFKKTDLAKYMNLLQMRPDIASAGGQKSFSQFSKNVTGKWEKEDSIFNEDYFKRVISLAIIFKESDHIIKAQAWYNSYKANIIAYTMAKLFYVIKNEYTDRAIDFKTIWLKQKLSDVWKKQIESLSKTMYEFLISDDRLVENVTEWAKREGCWKKAKELPVTLLPEFIEELQNSSIVKENKREAKKNQKALNDTNAMIKVANFGIENWKLLNNWNREHKVLTPIEMNFVDLAIAMEKGKFPSEKQCIRILRVLDKARDESFSK